MSENTEKINDINSEDTSAEKAAKKDSSDKNGKESLNIKNEILEWFDSFVFAMLIVQLVFIFVFRIVMVDGMSMSNTLINGDRLVMTHVNYTPERDDIVVLQSDVAEKILIKRVIGVEGDTVRVDYNDNHVYVNDQLISNDHIREIMRDNLIFFDGKYRIADGVYEYTVPKDSVFVMGDNRNNSKDSRAIGFVSNEDIMGKAVFRLYPFDSFGSVS